MRPARPAGKSCLFFYQSRRAPGNNKSVTATGVSGGLRWANKSVALTGSGYYGKGVGTTLMFLGASCTAGTCGSNGSDDLRTSYGYIGQLTNGIFGSNYQDVFAFIVLCTVLILRPSGLLGERVADRA